MFKQYHMSILNAQHTISVPARWKLETMHGFMIPFEISTLNLPNVWYTYLIAFEGFTAQ